MSIYSKYEVFGWNRFGSQLNIACGLEVFTQSFGFLYNATLIKNKKQKTEEAASC